MAQKKQVALVGGGPTAVYTLKNLLQKADGLHVTIFEAGKVAGCGIPYSDEFNTPDMMANITSVEIPPVMTSLADWVRSADKNWLSKFGIRRDDVSERDYYPRVLLGAYYVDQLEQMIRNAAPWHQVDIETQTRVLDIIPDGKGFTLAIANKECNRRRGGPCRAIRRLCRRGSRLVVSTARGNKAAPRHGVPQRNRAGCRFLLSDPRRAADDLHAGKAGEGARGRQSRPACPLIRTFQAATGCRRP
jgi:hypothetical protein